MSCMRAPALMRTIHRRRKSRFLFLRSRYAYFHPRSTFSFAAFQSLLRAPKAPRAAFITCFLRLRRTTFDLTRGIYRFSLCLQEALDVLLFAARLDHAFLAEAALTLRRLLGQDVALERLVALDLSRAGYRETLTRSAVAFHLRHCISLFCCR